MYASHRNHQTLYQDNPRPGNWTASRRPLKDKDTRTVERLATRNIRSLERELTDPATYAGMTPERARQERRNIQNKLRGERQFRATYGKRRHGRPLTRSFRKPSEVLAMTLIRDVLAERYAQGMTFVTAEMVVGWTHIHPAIVDKAFMRLNREGVLSQGKNQKHSDFEWVATDYTILRQP